MRLLVSNDDGFRAAGIGALVKALAAAGHEVYVAAPHRQRSAASRSMTLFDPLRAERVSLPDAPEVPAYAVNGTPVDCVRLALGNLFPAPDAVLSGVNDGGNLGTDTLYSGTVAAAHEAALLGYPAVAVSSCGRRPVHFETAARVALRAVERLVERPLPFGVVLNINVPDLPVGALRGVRTAPLAITQYPLRFEERTDPYGGRYFWAPGGDKLTRHAGEDVDERWTREGYAVCTPLTYDLTDRAVLGGFDPDGLLR